ncbi:unnamed protein product [Dibothriocephalus latus]|uniref:Ig-like domain-containing protein n=1 Tax=Dibothriocephalus latus TaxID=60516 RepID=A0A3P7NZK7_DIBLA|nr:unnamed protein product [Dibothriocephalus latus]
MDTRLDAASDYNEYEPCEDEAALTSSPFADHRPPPRGLPEVKSVRFRVQMWELVIRDLQQSDSGVYTCRLTGGTPQSIKYYLSVKFRIEAPRFARKNSAGRFVCAMETTHRNSSRVLLDWFRARKTSPAPRGPPFHFPASRYRRQTVELIESQPWNNITIYKQIVGERNDNLLLEAVLIMHRTSSQHTATYECQAGEILSGRISRVYDSLAFNFTAQMVKLGYIEISASNVIYKYW